MVNELVNIRDKNKYLRKFVKIFGIFLILFIVLAIVFTAGFLLKKSGGPVEIILDNPLKNIFFLNTNELGQVNQTAVLEQALLEFNADYINYILTMLGTHYLHSAPLFGNPKIEMILGEEVWNSELINQIPNTQQGTCDDEDLRIILSKEEAINAILSENPKQFMEDSVVEGKTQIVLVANKLELFGKGYLEMYSALTSDKNA